MYGHNDLKKEVMIELDGVPYVVVDNQHVSMGRGGAVMRTKLKNMLNGSTLERTFRPAEKIAPAAIERPKMQYLYADGDNMVFMNNETYDQDTVPRTVIGEQGNYLPEGFEVQLLVFKGKAIGVDMPHNIYLKVTQTEPGVKGNTANNALKPAIMETGVQVMVPLFINEDDVIKVDTRTGAYLERQK
jgi:elongation factor P